jgi:uncharacterized protein
MSSEAEQDQQQLTSEAPELQLGTIIPSPESSSSSFLDEEQEDRPFTINADLLATGRTSVIGSSGSGKSYAVGVICEELCKNRVPFVIIDIEGEYSGLKEKYEAIWVGDEEACDLKWGKIDLKLLARYAPDCPPLILDLSETDKPRDKVAAFLLAIYREISKRRTPYLVILEEADRFAPQVGDRLPIFDEVARRGRKRGLGLMLCTQRPSLVDKNILSQCSNQLIGKLVIRNDLNSVAQFFSSRGAPTQLTTLSPGEFFALGGLSGSDQLRVKIRKRETRHGGNTPKLNAATLRPSVQNVISALESERPPPNQNVLQTNQLTAIPKAVVPLKKTEILNPSVFASAEQQVEEAAESIVRKEIESKNRRPEILGFLPLIDQNDVPRLVRAEKEHKFFGQKETTVNVTLMFHPLIEVGVRKRTGIIKKKFESMFFYLDGLSGRLLQLADGKLSFGYGLEHLLGLEEGHILVLRALHPDRDLSLVEIASASRIPEDQIRNLVRSLENQRLVRSSKLGRIKVYRRMVDLPKIELMKPGSLQPVDLSSESIVQIPLLREKLQQSKLKEQQVREIVKGLWDDTDVESFRAFYYPVYVAELVLNSKSRKVYIDGRTGIEI